MKKILIVMMMCLMSAVTFGKLSYLNARRCTATYIHKYFDSNMVNYRTTVIINSASTCALAMKQAKEMALKQSIEIEPTLPEGGNVVEEPTVDEIAELTP
jgi:heme/copper-type cytochrome/quinol oxidase subunit 3